MNPGSKNVVIGIAEMGFVKVPNSITTYALGSCVGVVLYDAITRSAGMVHVLLPSSQIDTNPAAVKNKAKYGDLAVQALLDLMIKNGCKKQNLRAKVAGGANMFRSTLPKSSLINVGARNIESCKKELMRLNLPIIAEDTGQFCGRTIVLDTVTGNLLVKTIGQGSKNI